MNNTSFARNMLRFLRAWFLRVLAAAWRSNAARVFFVIWILIVAVAPLREIALTTFMSDDRFYNVFSENESDFGDEVHLAPTLSERISFIENHRSPSLSVGFYRELLQKNPRDGFLIARYLVLSLCDVPFHRQVVYAGEKPYELQISQTEKSAQSDRLEGLVSIARRGQEIEPQNAFFDAVLVRIFVSLERDEEAYRVLDASRDKNIFDDYSMQVMNILFEVLDDKHPHRI